MAIVYMGARGKTAEEIAKVLHFTLPQEEVAPAFQSLLATLPGANHPGCTLTVANRLWGQQGYGFLQPFVTTTRDRFGGGLAEVDFAKPAAVCDLINAWADQANGREDQADRCPKFDFAAVAVHRNQCRLLQRSMGRIVQGGRDEDRPVLFGRRPHRGPVDAPTDALPLRVV